MHIIDSHWMECPSALCHDMTLLVCQLSMLGNTSVYLERSAYIILATTLPFSSISPSDDKFTFCMCLLCLPLILGVWTLLFWNGMSALFVEIKSVELEWSSCGITFWMSDTSVNFCCLLSSSDSAMKSLTDSSVISYADSAACSLRNWPRVWKKI